MDLEYAPLLDKRLFRLIFNISEVAHLGKEERMAYEASLKSKWDTQNAFDTVRREALHEGINEAKVEVVKNLLLSTSFSVERIASLAVVSEDFVLKVQAELKVN